VATNWAIKAAPARTLVRCARHRDVDAAFHCGRCRLDFCALCVKQFDERGVAFKVCHCGGRCEAIEVVAPPKSNRDFGAELVDAFAFPFRGEARWQMVLGAAMFGGTSWLFGGTLANALPMVSPTSPLGPFAFWMVMGAVLALVGVAGYLFAYVELVIAHTAKGRDDPPGFPDFLTVWESMMKPIGRLFLLLVIAFGPGTLLVALLPGGAKLLGVVLLLAGLAYFPMALLAVAIFEGDQGFDPRRVVAAIQLVPRHYAIAAALFLLTFALMLGGGLFLVGLPAIGGLLRGALAFYMATVAGRVLGLTYRNHAKGFRWI
jgi:hypothetical protein